MDFKNQVIEALRSALGDDAPDGLEGLLAAPPRPELGDLAFPCFPLAKSWRRAPAQIAPELAERIPTGGAIREVAVEGAYVNFFADTAGVLASYARAVADGGLSRELRAETPARVMVEHSQPNTHKAFHVGHLRNVALGDSLVRVLRARGHDVVAANYYGDFGIDVAKCLWRLGSLGEWEPPPEGQRTAWLGQRYVEANVALESDGDPDPEVLARRAEVRAVLAEMEQPDTEVRRLYETTRQWCLDEFHALYAWLDVRFDVEFFESELEERAQRIVSDYLERGVLVESDGAIIGDLRDEDLGVAIVRKRDGSSLYMTWDLALAREKFERFDIERSLYVVGSEQVLHFRQLFAVLRRMGYDRAADCRHVAYELVMLPDGKMSSRAGTAVPFHELRERVVEAIETKMRDEPPPDGDDWTDDERRAVAERIAVACLKYGMLSVGTTSRVVFDIESWINPRGDTGAYLLYSLARVGGIFRKSGAADLATVAAAIPSAEEFGNEAERALLHHLRDFPRVVGRVEQTADPSVLAGYLYEAARRFSRFYHDCPVVRAEEPLRTCRLALVGVYGEVVAEGLRLLGIEPLGAM